MNRKEFLKKTALASFALSSFSATDVFAGKVLQLTGQDVDAMLELAPVSEQVEKHFISLISWIKESKWSDFLKQNLGIDINKTGEDLRKELISDIDAIRLKSLKSSGAGFDDFAGTKLIDPGRPSYSLLYHALASPRVKPRIVKSFASLSQLDALENYIYALKRWEDYGMDTPDDLVLAVFAYEYRPAAKTPHHAHADMVYSRTAVARIGEMPLNYDAAGRHFTNKPRNEDDPSAKKIAVTPARYGLFLAKVVSREDISLLSTERYKGNGSYVDQFDDKDDGNKSFLLPIRKIFNSDLLFDNINLKFKENHVNEKLALLLENPGLRRTSETLVEQDVNLSNTGSSFLVIPKPAQLIKKVEGISWLVDTDSDNRYFTSYSKKDAAGEGFLIETISGNGRYRTANNYKAPRNLPMYVHLAHKIGSTGVTEQIPKTNDKTFEDIINAGNYYVPIFEDSICDGAVSVELLGVKNVILKTVTDKGILPAFSIITAPDFFPYVDVFDIKEFDVAPGTNSESNFFEGGVASLASARIRPNPNLPNPVRTGLTAFPSSNNQNQLINTFTAVISDATNPSSSFEKDFNHVSYLPDSCSSVFAPGWDVTYADAEDKAFLSTQGLGAPFVEDMKLCAAMNGMWAVASPDTARVFQGTVTSDQVYWYANPTAIPLMDTELGFHESSPASILTKQKFPFGWDGEQGPFLQKVNGVWMVNFTDLGRADYVQNALDGKFDMSSLRELDNHEIEKRMSVLKKCISKLANTSVAQNQLWLVSAEKFEAGKFIGDGIPVDLFGSRNDWATKPQLPNYDKESYFLFVFVETFKDRNQISRVWAPNQPINQVKRRLQKCVNLFVCQVSTASLRYCEVIIRGRLVKTIIWKA